MTTSQRLSLSVHRLGVFVAAIMLLVTSMADAVFGGEIATCGRSSGYGYYPKAGLTANNAPRKWVEDAISGGKFTLTQTSEKEFDLLITDTSGRVFSAKQDGGVVVLEAEVMWTSNKGGGAPVMKVAAYRADCSFFAF